MKWIIESIKTIHEVSERFQKKKTCFILDYYIRDKIIDDNRIFWLWVPNIINTLFWDDVFIFDYSNSDKKVSEDSYYDYHMMNLLFNEKYTEVILYTKNIQRISKSKL